METGTETALRSDAGAAAEAPLVSIVIPAHNRPALLAEAVQSVASQTLKNIEIIIALSATTEENRAAALDLCRIHGARIAETAKPNLSAARNVGIAAARADWIAFLDDDDIWLPEKLEKQFAAAEKSGADLVSCDFRLFNEQGPIEGVKLSPVPEGLSMAEALMLNNYLSGGSAAMVRKSVLTELGGFDENLRSVEDQDMWRRVAWRHTIVVIGEPLVRIRKHAGNMQENSKLMLEGVTAHFAKLLRDTPPRLQHNLPRACSNFLATFGSHAENIGFLPRPEPQTHATDHQPAPAADVSGKPRLAPVPKKPRRGLRKLAHKFKKWRKGL